MVCDLTARVELVQKVGSHPGFKTCPQIKGYNLTAKGASRGLMSAPLVSIFQ